MSWSVRTCTDCGDYKYVEDGVCRDCQSSTSYLDGKGTEALREVIEDGELDELPKKGLGKSIKTLRREDVDGIIKIVHHARSVGQVRRQLLLRMVKDEMSTMSAEKASEVDVDADELAEEIENGGGSV